MKHTNYRILAISLMCIVIGCNSNREATEPSAPPEPRVTNRDTSSAVASEAPPAPSPELELNYRVLGAAADGSREVVLEYSVAVYFEESFTIQNADGTIQTATRMIPSLESREAAVVVPPDVDLESYLRKWIEQATAN